jgi:hypothetical protein
MFALTCLASNCNSETFRAWCAHLAIGRRRRNVAAKFGSTTLLGFTQDPKFDGSLTCQHTFESKLDSLSVQDPMHMQAHGPARPSCKHDCPSAHVCAVAVLWLLSSEDVPQQSFRPRNVRLAKTMAPKTDHQSTNKVSTTPPTWHQGN